jgi:hypothetical protein
LVHSRRIVFFILAKSLLSLNFQGQRFSTSSLVGNPAAALADSHQLTAKDFHDSTNGERWRALWPASEGVDAIATRPLLSADALYHVATTGDDATGNGSSGAPWKTIQKAVDFVNSIDLSGFSVSIHLEDGTYNENVQLKPYFGRGGQGHTTPSINGNATTPGNVIIHAAAGNAIAGVETGDFEWVISNLQVEAPAGTAILADKGAWVVIGGGINFGTATLHLQSNHDGFVEVTGNCTIVGDAFALMKAGVKSEILVQSGVTIAASGTRAFTILVQATENSVIYLEGALSSGTVTTSNSKFFADTGGGISTKNASANFFASSGSNNITSLGWTD